MDLSAWHRKRTTLVAIVTGYCGLTGVKLSLLTCTVNLTLSLVKKQASPTEQQWKNKSWMTAKGMLTKNESLWNKKEVATILTCYIWMNVNEIKLWEQAESSWEQDFQREITFRSVLHLNQKTWKVVLAALMVFLSCLVRLKNMWPLQSKFCL